MDATQQPARQQVRMRGRSYVAFVFTPVVPIVSWLEEIDQTLARSPGFFTGKPVVLDLASVDLSAAAIAHLVGSLDQRNIRVLGIEGVDEAKLGANLPPLLTGGRACAITHVDPPPQAKTKAKSPSLLLESPVRSGQSVFAEGDVTVLGSVGSGAEIVAGGSIHVYGTLRGRAMAGINGNSSARIFCQRIEAELLAIDGYYQTAEQISDSLRNRPAQAWLEGEMLRITALN
ncbi:septum site-determining protein MinC [Bradyrhizobium sp. ISRA443]|uniref:septum site-determining protein MinC n=1 Tax=unclassified Bradyrhizobium TaxID=2631580 RepID=UPI0024784708|nr:MULTISPECIES: septum site-determining protein MinC [unclassified Bradyrhizobium]WGR94946.1 septum site-determining protein MinC [Bradyrhizobium sp. ISRA435]WGR99805.1 septum site-determining protein MinC [Bradyrhizobium sp. ISRA436]WGS06695.1 septum site-determining protein MinC [Bradyrhizobium sp. ISRA437]WGS13579.1 septum site-determining protein MinC [Bradyrhizobium sp. ISRA443]